MEPRHPDTSTASQNRATHSFVLTLRRVIRVSDLSILGVIPSVLTVVFLLPPSLRRSYSFHYLDPTIVSAFTTHFVHLSLRHFLENLLIYCLVISITYTLFTLAGRRQFFYMTFVTILLVFPFVLSYMNLLVPRNAIGFGFSGINTAFLALVPIAMACYANEQLSMHFRPRFAGGAFLLSLAAIAVSLVSISWESASIALSACFGSGLHTQTMHSRDEDSVGRLDRVVHSAGFGDLFVLAGVAWISLVVVIFSTAKLHSNAQLNHYVHLLGYCLSFLMAYLAIEL